MLPGFTKGSRGFARILGILALAGATMGSSFQVAAAIGYEGARHLLNRVGFGATDAEIAASAELTRAEAMDRRSLCNTLTKMYT